MLCEGGSAEQARLIIILIVKHYKQEAIGRHPCAKPNLAQEHPCCKQDNCYPPKQRMRGKSPFPETYLVLLDKIKALV